MPLYVKGLQYNTWGGTHRASLWSLLLHCCTGAVVRSSFPPWTWANTVQHSGGVNMQGKVIPFPQSYFPVYNHTNLVHLHQIWLGEKWKCISSPLPLWNGHCWNSRVSSALPTTCINFTSFLKSYFLHKLHEWQDRNEWLHPTLEGQVISSTRSIGVINKQSTQVHQFHLSILPEDTVNEVLYLPQTCCNFKLLHFITALHLNDWCQELATVKLITYWHFQPLSLSLKFGSNIKE